MIMNALTQRNIVYFTNIHEKASLNEFFANQCTVIDASSELYLSHQPFSLYPCTNLHLHGKHFYFSIVLGTLV